MLDKIISYSFYTLFFLTPLFWTPWNYELFEYNKMIVTYFLTVLITGTWVWKMVDQKSFIFKITPLHIPLTLFLITNIISTVYSIDPHTSVWGYYSRSNGGLLSIVSYLLLFCAFVSNIGKDETIKLLKIALAGGVAVALWAIPEHFGISPSCLILRGDLTADCWIQDVQARVFATLGQPNWLAAYLGMLIFPAIYFYIKAADKFKKIIYYIVITTLYIAFTFTYSRGGALGVIAGTGLFTLFYLFYSPLSKFVNNLSLNFKVQEDTDYITRNGSKQFLIVLASLVVVNIIFGSALIRFQLTNLLPKNAPSVTTQKVTQPSSVTQLDTGGTESGQIRLIVWQGALDIFKNYPLFGSGVETFAYSYYKFRPVSHNLVSEWDFLYNKAHNEYLNYLATTGIFGFSTYMLFIGIFILWCLKRLLVDKSGDKLLTLAILSAYVVYLVQNFFGFSVVMIALLFYLLPAIAFVNSGSVKNLPDLKILSLKPIYIKVIKILIILITLSLVYNIIKLWYADSLFALGEKASESGNPGKAYNYLSDAVSLNKGEPFYKSELGYSAASAALALADQDATLSGEIKESAIYETSKALTISPANISFWRTAIRTYYQLAPLDPRYTQKTLETIDKTITLAPTDPKLYYNKAVILGQIDKNTEAIEVLQKAIALKPNYREGYFALALFYFDISTSKQIATDSVKMKSYQQQAVNTMGNVLKLVPNDGDALKQLEEWGKKGVATGSATF